MAYQMRCGSTIDKLFGEKWVLMKLCKAPSEDVRLAAYRLFETLAATGWGIEKMLLQAYFCVCMWCACHTFACVHVCVCTHMRACACTCAVVSARAHTCRCACVFVQKGVRACVRACLRARE